MKKSAWAALGLALLMIQSSAVAEETFDGTVVAGETISITAPFGGTVKSLALQTGEWLQAGDTVATLSTTRVLATQDGTVRGITAQPGDSASGTVLYLSPVNRYTISCTLSKAAETAETKYVRLGERVYIQCVKDGTHQAVGIVSAVNGSSYTVLTTAGEMYLQESCYVYRSADYDTDTRIGSGVVTRTEEVAVSGSGSILKFFVENGDEVERGQALFETVDGDLDALLPVDSGAVLAQQAGVVTQVNASAGAQVRKGDTLAVLALRESYEVSFSIPEDLLHAVEVGQQVNIYFNWNEDKSTPAQGIITDISYVNETTQGGSGEASSGATYTGYASFTADDTVRLGMTVTVIPVETEVEVEVEVSEDAE